MKSKPGRRGSKPFSRGVMRSWNVFFLLLGTILCLVSCDNSASKNTTTTEERSDFIEALAIPDFHIATTPDSARFSISSASENELVLIKYFSPDCDHCQEEAQAYVSKKDSLKNIKTIWVAGEWAKLNAVEEFAKKYQLEQLNPLAVGKDVSHDFAPFYGISGVPFTAVYKGNQLLKQYTGALDFSELISINDGTYVPEPKVIEPQKEALIEEPKKS